MPPPTFIEFNCANGERLHLIFQCKQFPLLSEESHGDVFWVNRCPDDGTLFLEGCPEDYVNATVCLDPPNGALYFELSADMVEVTMTACSCAFGAVMDSEGGGAGPGFTYDGKVFAHDKSLGISNEVARSQELMGCSTGLILFINREDEHEYRKYYDEQDPPKSSPEEGGSEESFECLEYDRADVAMDESEGTNEVPTKNFADELASQMKTLRLKGR